MWKSAGRAPSLRVLPTLAFALQLRKKHGKTSVSYNDPLQTSPSFQALFKYHCNIILLYSVKS